MANDMISKRVSDKDNNIYDKLINLDLSILRY